MAISEAQVLNHQPIPHHVLERIAN